MNITKEADDMIGKSYNVYKLELTKATQLLKEALFFINQIPNKKYEAFLYKDSYELASEISKFLKNG